MHIYCHFLFLHPQLGDHLIYCLRQDPLRVKRRTKLHGDNRSPGQPLLILSFSSDPSSSSEMKTMCNHIIGSLGQLTAHIYARKTYFIF